MLIWYSFVMSNYRILNKKIKEHFGQYKQALVLIGARQVGKTTLLQNIYAEALYLTVDNENIRRQLETYNIETYKYLFAGKKNIILDEVHLLSEPGRALKIIYDQTPDVQLIATGSSSLHIKNKTSESMAGRKITYHMYPLTFTESLIQQGIAILKDKNIIDSILNTPKVTPKLYPQQEMLQNILKFGLYPVTINISDRSHYLKELANDAIFKDIVDLNLIEDRGNALQLLKLLAHQIGNIINYEELSRKLSLDRRTVERYIEIFEQSFILYRLYPFSKDRRNEIGKSPKIYFWDLGLRNALINNFEDINIRGDSGALFESFIITEVKKEVEYLDLNFEVHYWRVKSGYEVDLVLSSHKELIGVELKLNKGSITKAFTNRYPEAKTIVINSENFF